MLSGKKNRQIPAKYSSQLDEIQVIGNCYSNLTDMELKLKVFSLKKRIRNNGIQQDSILEAFALVREATKRILTIQHYDVQLFGGLVLNEGKIAEMNTGEGKTIVAILPAFLNVLMGKYTHIITVNDYLARRDSEYVGGVYRFLGLSVGLIQENMPREERKKNYKCDVVYVTHSELGFDYLKDNLVLSEEEIVLGPLDFVIIDEIDSILIDEAQTPLIISGPSEESSEKYSKSSMLASSLRRDLHYNVNEKEKSVLITNEGIIFCKKALNLNSLTDRKDVWLPYILNSIKAKEFYMLGRNYLIDKKNEVVIVDEFTGRLMNGKRWGDGIHQAVEAKEGLTIQGQNQTLASITYQNLFLLYEKLSGMTGTAKTEEFELQTFYNLSVVQIPTNRPIKRKDFPDLFHKNQCSKWLGVVKECLYRYQRKQPILVGTATIKNSELLGSLLDIECVPYQLLNAKSGDVFRESEIIAQAGCLNAITIATNMAGRGTDIILGGDSKFLVTSIFKSQLKNIKMNEINDRQTGKNLNFLIKNHPEIIEEFHNKQKDNFQSSNSQLYPFYKSLFKKRKKIAKIEREAIIKLGGLHVLGTERHEARRIDYQLRGRAGRQGDPGSSEFFLSLDDKLFRLFSRDAIIKRVKRFAFSGSVESFKSPLLSQSLESSQKAMENFYFESRKKLFDYDQVLNLQRNMIYNGRKQILKCDNIHYRITEYFEQGNCDLLRYIQRAVPSNEVCKIYNSKTKELIHNSFNIKLLNCDQKKVNTLEFIQQQFQIIHDLNKVKVESLEKTLMEELEKTFLLQQIDISWQEHLQISSFLRDAVTIKMYGGQINPLTEYKREIYDYFVIMLMKIKQRVFQTLIKPDILQTK